MASESTEENVRPNCLGVRHLQTALLAAAMMLQVITTATTMTTLDYMRSGDMYHDKRATTNIALFPYFFWSLVVAQIPAGELATRFGGKLLLTLSLLVNILTTLLIPLIVDIFGFENLGWYLLCICFGLLGVSKSLVDPSMQNLIGQWIPLEEKGLLTTIIYSGNVLSVVLPQILLTNHFQLWFGWQYIYYAYGVQGAVWIMAYVYLGSDSPEHSKFILKTELSYIQKSLRRVGVQQKHTTPYWKIMTSLPVWAVIVAHCGHVCGFFILKALYDRISRGVGVFPYLPYLATFFFSIPVALISDLIVRMNWLSVTKTRKLFNSIGLWIPAMILIFLAFSSLNKMPVIFLYVAAFGIAACHYIVLLMVYTDLSPNFSANLISITTFFGNVAALAVRENNEYILHSLPYYATLLTVAGVFFFCNLFFVIFASAERQPWNEPGTKHIVVPADVVLADVVPADVVPADVDPADVVPADVVPADVVPADVVPADVVPADVVPADVDPAEVDPADVDPADVDPADVVPAVMDPADVVPRGKTALY